MSKQIYTGNKWYQGSISVIVGLFITVLLFILSMILITIPVVNNTIVGSRKEMLVELIRVAESIIERHYEYQKLGVKNEEEAKAGALSDIRLLRYGNSNKEYYWIIDSNSKMLMHPYRPELESQSLWHYRDSHGKYLFKEVHRKAKDSGHGYIEYYWPYYDSDEEMAKLSYVKMMNDWGWILGTGVYMDKIQASMDDLVLHLYKIFGGILVCVILISLYIVWQMSKLDIKRREAKRVLEENEEKYRLLFKTANDGIVLLKDYSVIDCNQKVLEIFDVSEQEIMGKNILDVSPEYQLNGRRSEELILEKYKELAINNVIIFEWVCLAAKGRQIYLEITFNRIEINGEDLIFAINRDITELKEALGVEAEAKKKLEERVMERTEELESAYKDLKEFTYIASHDLKTPLHGISQPIHWLKSDYEDKLDDHAVELLDIVLDRVNRMDKNINGIIQYLRAGRYSVEREHINLGILVDNVMKMLDTDKSVELNILDKLPDIYGDRIHYEEIFLNILKNAIIFNDKAQCKIDISVEDYENYWDIGIQDNGPGINSKYQDKIFGMFQTLKKKDEGRTTGMGLAIVKKLIELENGGIRVESESGAGAKFILTVAK